MKIRPPHRPGPLWYVALTIAVLLAAAYLRVHQISLWPPGLTLDEGNNALDALRITRTGAPPVYRADGSPEPLFHYLQALTISLFGKTRFGLRMASVYTGIISVAAAARAGRHLALPGHAARRRWSALAAGAMMAVLVGHVTLSRVAYRAVLLPLGVLLFVDSFVSAWQTGRRGAFAWAGVWLAVCVDSYTAGLMTPAVALLAVLHQAVFDPPRLKRRLKGLLACGVAFALATIPLLVIVIVQPATYTRVGALASEGPPAAFADRVQLAGLNLWKTWLTFSARGDINPQYNVEQAPLLHTSFLYGLLLLGVVGSVLRPRRLVSILAVGLLVAFMIPVAFAGEIPHGVRTAGEFGVIPLLVAGGVVCLSWLGDRLKSARVPLQVGLGLLLGAVFVHGAVQTGQLYFGFWEKDIIYESAGMNTFSWFFKGGRTALAAYLEDQPEPVYVPLSEANSSTLRYLTLNSHPTVRTFADDIAPDGSLSYPAGVFALPPGSDLTGSYALFTQEGEIVLLPLLDDQTQAALRAERDASRAVLRDTQGEVAAEMVRFPPDGSDIRFEQAIAYPASIDFDGQLHLVGWAGPSQLPSELDPAQEFEFTLYFEPGSRQRLDLDVFAQVWTLDDENLGGRDGEINRWVYPNSVWQPGDFVPVTLRFSLAEEPTDLSPGGYRLAVGVNDTRGRRLPVIGADGAPLGDVAYAGGLKVPSEAAPDLSGMQPVEWQVGDAIDLIGYQLARDGEPVGTLAPGDEATLTLAWQATARPAADYTTFFHLVDADGDTVAQYDVQPADGLFPTSVWDAGEIYTSVHPVVVPPDAGAGPYRLLVGMYGWPDLERLPVTSTGGDAPDDRRIPLLTLP